MTNIVMISRDRPDLTRQTLNSMWKHTQVEFNLTVVDDASRDKVLCYPEEVVQSKATQFVELSRPVGIVGLAKNLGATLSEKTFGKGEWLYFTDNDVYFRPGWLGIMQAVMRGNENIGVLGGCRHPYHQPNSKTHLHGGMRYLHHEMELEETDAVAGYSMLMRWELWDLWGGFDQHAVGTGQSEDFAFCQKVKAAGLKVGYVSPSTVLHCGVTDTNWNKVVGWEQLEMPNEGEVKEGVVML